MMEDSSEVQGDRPVVDATGAADASCSPFGDAGLLSDGPSSRSATRSNPVGVEMASDTEDQSDAGDEASGLSKLKQQFNWKQALADVDKDYDEKERLEEQNPAVARSSRHLFATSPMSALPSSASTSSAKLPVASPKSRTARRSLVRASSSESASDRDTGPERSSSTARKSKKPRRAILPTSDADEASPIHTSSQADVHPSLKSRGNSSPSSEISPVSDRVFGSPPLPDAQNNTARPSSPPTSPNNEEEEPAATARVAAVDFTSEMAKGKNMKRRKSDDRTAKEKPQKIKSLSKKERLNMTKEQGRMMACACVFPRIVHASSYIPQVSLWRPCNSETGHPSGACGAAPLSDQQFVFESVSVCGRRRLRSLAHISGSVPSVAAKSPTSREVRLV